MPELPEVQTTVNGLNRTVKGRRIVDMWTDYPERKPSASYGASRMYRESIKNKNFFKIFKKKVKGKKILKAERRAKNILIHLSPRPGSGQAGQTILVHMKMTGHFVYDKPGHPHVRFSMKLDNGKILGLSDMRRFAKVTLIPTKDLGHSPHLANIGPEPLEKSFKFENFRSQVLRRPNGKIKQVLMDPSVIAGIGNIYSDEILWRAGVHPLSRVESIPLKNKKLMFTAMKKVLKRGIDFGGDSMSDYRNIKGERGKFQDYHQAYRRTGKPCKKLVRSAKASGSTRCKGVIKRTVVGGRSAHYCGEHQGFFA